MRVTSKKTISFSKLGWGIHAGEERELPKDKDAAEIILRHPSIMEIKEKRQQTPSQDKSDDK